MHRCACFVIIRATFAVHEIVIRKAKPFICGEPLLEESSLFWEDNVEGGGTSFSVGSSSSVEEAEVVISDVEVLSGG